MTGSQVDVKCVPCHYGLARPQDADKRDGLKIWGLAANILNNQSWTDDKGRTSSLGFGRPGCQPLTLEYVVSYEMLHRCSDLDRFYKLVLNVSCETDSFFIFLLSISG